MPNATAGTGPVKPTDAHSTGPLYVTVMSGGDLGPSGTPYIELDPNNFEIRFNPPLNTSGFLNDAWPLVIADYGILGYPASTILNAYNTPATGTAVHDGARVIFSDFDDADRVSMAVHWASGTDFEVVEINSGFYGASVWLRNQTTAYVRIEPGLVEVVSAAGGVQSLDGIPAATPTTLADVIAILTARGFCT